MADNKNSPSSCSACISSSKILEWVIGKVSKRLLPQGVCGKIEWLVMSMLSHFTRVAPVAHVAPPKGLDALFDSTMEHYILPCRLTCERSYFLASSTRLSVACMLRSPNHGGMSKLQSLTHGKLRRLLSAGPSIVNTGLLPTS